MTVCNCFGQTSWRLSAVACLFLAAVLTVGCSQGPGRVTAPGINASRAGRLAIEQYDTDGDDLIGGEELTKAAGVNAALANIDTNGDGKASAEEIAERVKSWQAAGTGLTSINCRVELDGSPLVGAEVTFEPESFLGDEIRAAVGTTKRLGMASPIIPKEDRPSPDTPPGIALGLYKVKVSWKQGGSERIPSKYNTETILGQEVAYDDPNYATNRVIFRLESK